MNPAIGEWVTTSRQKLAAGTLTAQDLDRLADLATSPRQLVLYLYSKSTNMRSALASWKLYDVTKPEEPTLPSQQAPYESVLAAVGDGWRIVQFPDAKLYAYQGVDNDYLGFEVLLLPAVSGDRGRSHDDPARIALSGSRSRGHRPLRRHFGPGVAHGTGRYGSDDPLWYLAQGRSEDQSATAGDDQVFLSPAGGAPT